MKRFLKIFGLSLAGVIVGIALLIGGGWLFGAFTEKPVKPKDIAFVETEVSTSNMTALRVNTTTEGVNRKNLQIDVSPSGIIKCPKKATIGEDFIIVPEKGDDGYNVGGIVTITASFEGMYIAKCIVKVDVPVADAIVKTSHTSLSKGEQISFSTEVIPARALSPWKTDIIGDLYDDRAKVIYYFLCDADGALMDISKAYFYVSGRSTNMLTSKQINAQTKIVAQEECNFYVKSYCFSTFAREDYYNVATAEDMLYTDGRGEIQEKYRAVLKESRAENGDKNGQFVNVADVYINSFTASDETINTFWYETQNLTVRKDENAEDSSYNLDIKLHPAESSEGYTYLDLDNFIDNIVLERIAGADVTVTKVGQFTSGKPADWKWTVTPNTYSSTDTTATLRATIHYIDSEQKEQVLTHDFNVSINTRDVAGITANEFEDESGTKRDYVSLNSDSPSTDSIKLEEGMYTTILDSGLLSHYYKYFKIVPQTGYGYSTFSLLKFFIPENSVIVPYTAGTYKVTFEFDAKNDGDYRIVFSDGSSNIGNIVYFKYDDKTNTWEESGSPAGQTGKFRAEVMFKKTNEQPLTFEFQDSTKTPVKIIDVSNVLYYTENSEYPFLEINGVKVKTFFNSDTRVITRQLAEVTAEGFGNFTLIACVVVSDNNGSIIYSEDGNFEKIMSKTIEVRVTNSVKDLELNIVDSEGGTKGIAQGDFNKTVVVDENAEYYINIAPGPNTALDVLKQAVEAGNVNVTYKVNGDAKNSDGVQINADALNIGLLEEDRDGEGNLVGYKFLLEVKNVYSIENARGETQNILFTLTISVEGTNFSINKTIEVRDHVIKEAVISYDGSTANSMRIYAANVDNSGKVGFKEWSRQQVIDLNKFSFTFESEYGVIDVEPEIEFAAAKNVVTTGIISAVKNAEGKWVLELGNFPYYDDGVAVTITMKYGGSNEDVNKRYVYNATLDLYELKSYENSSANYTLTINGFEITYAVKAAEVVGVKDQTVNILDPKFVTVTIRDGKKSNVTVDIVKIVNFGMIESEYFSFDSTTTTITIKKSITTPQSIMVALTIGANRFATHSLTFKSPFTVEQVKTDTIKAPSENVNIASYFSVKKDKTAVEADMIEYSFGSSKVLSNGKTVGDYISLNGSSITAKYIPFDIDVDIYITIYEKNGEIRENKGTFDGFTITFVNDYLTNNTVKIQGSSDNVIYGNKANNYVDISSVYSGSDYTMTMSFKNNKLDPQDETTQFVFAGVKDDNYGYSIYACDIVTTEDIAIEVTLYITIPGNGDTVVIFTIFVRQYITIEFANNSSIQSGGSTGKDVSTLDNFKITNPQGEVVSLGEGGIEQYLEVKVADDSKDLLEIRSVSTEMTSVIFAKSGVQEATEAHIIVTRKIYAGSGMQHSYTIDYVLTVHILPEA